MKKLTYTEALEMVLEVQEVKENETLVEKLTTLLEQMSKKGSGKSASAKAKQEENDSIKIEILDTLGDSEESAKAIKELQAENETLGSYTNQKLSALIRQLVAEGEVIRVEEKRVAKFYLSTQTVEPTEVQVKENEISVSL